jgi:hypothetical protein
MALTFEELEAVTDDYFMADGGKAVDIYFKTSFLLNFLLDQQKGIWERPDGGHRIRIPLEYGGQEASFYGRGATISSDDKETVNAAYFEWKHAYGNATIYRVDELENAGRYAEISLAAQRIAGSQKSITKLLAGSIYDLPGGDTTRLTGLRACCNETTSVAFGNLAEDDVVDPQDGTKPWEGKMVSTATTISLNVIRTAASTTKLRDGENGKPDLMVTTEDIWNIIADILQRQQRFADGKETAKAGFTGLHFEGKDIFPDDYCPASHFFLINSKHIGFAVHQKGYFMRAPWRVIPDSPEDRTMKIYFDGNLVVNNRKAHIGYSNVS